MDKSQITNAKSQIILTQISNQITILVKFEIQKF